MPTVDRKNDTDEKHSLSSFDKRKVQSVTFGARQIDRKKYRVVKHGYGTVAAQNVSASLVNNTNSDEPTTFKNNSAKPDIHNFIHQGNAESKANTSNSVIPSEAAQRMQRAEYIRQMNNESISRNISSAKYFSEEETVSTENAKSVEMNLCSDCEKKGNTIPLEKRSEIPEHQNDISPETALRMKRAAFLAQQNKEAIMLNTATVISDETETEKTSEIPADVFSENKENKPENREPSFESRFTGNSENISVGEKSDERHSFAVNQAYEKHRENVRRKQHENAEKSSVLDNISQTADIAGKLAHGEVGKVAADIVVRNALSENGLRDTAQTIGNAVSGSASVESAVPDVSATLAAVEAKKFVAKIMKGESSEKDKRFVEEHKANGRTKYVDPDKERHRVEHRISDNEEISEDMSREERRNFLHNKRVAEKQKSFYADRMQTKRKNKQKEMFLEFNRDNPELVSNSAKGAGKRYVKKKAAKALIGGGAAAAAFPIIIVIIIFAVIAAFFGWLSPFDYTLAGDEGEEDDRKYTAESNAEVIDGYTKMIKNFMDVSQAYYYLNYGDWYGGTYDYPAPDLSFSEFFSEYCQNIVSEIRSQFSASMAAAKNDRERAAIAQAMSRAISEAIDAAMPQALAEYNALMESLDDSMSAETKRQHYETKNKGGTNGCADSAEFTGMPIVGTNQFGNVEINSSLSAEELLAYIALYKSMNIIAPDENDPDAEQILNITPQDIMNFLKETEFIKITSEVTHHNFCGGQNCKRRLVDKSWEYYCDGDHDNLTGEIGDCLTADELRKKIMEITDSEANGVDEKSFKKLIEEYMKLIKKELDITEADFRKFGASDNAKAWEFYQKLIDSGEIPNNYWSVSTPIGGEESNE